MEFIDNVIIIDFRGKSTGETNRLCIFDDSKVQEALDDVSIDCDVDKVLKLENHETDFFEFEIERKSLNCVFVSYATNAFKSSCILYDDQAFSPFIAEKKIKARYLANNCVIVFYKYLCKAEVLAGLDGKFWELLT